MSIAVNRKPAIQSTRLKSSYRSATARDAGKFPSRKLCRCFSSVCSEALAIDTYILYLIYKKKTALSRALFS